MLRCSEIPTVETNALEWHSAKVYCTLATNDNLRVYALDLSTIDAVIGTQWENLAF